MLPTTAVLILLVCASLVASGSVATELTAHTWPLLPGYLPTVNGTHGIPASAAYTPRILDVDATAVLRPWNLTFMVRCHHSAVIVNNSVTVSLLWDGSDVASWINGVLIPLFLRQQNANPSDASINDFIVSPAAAQLGLSSSNDSWAAGFWSISWERHDTALGPRWVRPNGPMRAAADDASVSQWLQSLHPLEVQAMLIKAMETCNVSSAPRASVENYFNERHIIDDAITHVLDACNHVSVITALNVTEGAAGSAECKVFQSMMASAEIPWSSDQRMASLVPVRLRAPLILPVTARIGSSNTSTRDFHFSNPKEDVLMHGTVEMPYPSAAQVSLFAGLRSYPFADVDTEMGTSVPLHGIVWSATLDVSSYVSSNGSNPLLRRRALSAVAAYLEGSLSVSAVAAEANGFLSPLKTTRCTADTPRDDGNVSVWWNASLRLNVSCYLVAPPMTVNTDPLKLNVTFARQRTNTSTVLVLTVSVVNSSSLLPVTLHVSLPSGWVPGFGSEGCRDDVFPPRNITGECLGVALSLSSGMVWGPYVNLQHSIVQQAGEWSQFRLTSNLPLNGSSNDVDAALPSSLLTSIPPLREALLPAATSAVGAISGVCVAVAILLRAAVSISKCSAVAADRRGVSGQQLRRVWKARQVAASAIAAFGVVCSMACLLLVGVGYDATTYSMPYSAVVEMYWSTPADGNGSDDAVTPRQLLFVDAVVVAPSSDRRWGAAAVTGEMAVAAFDEMIAAVWEAWDRAPPTTLQPHTVTALGDSYGSPGMSRVGLAICSSDGSLIAVYLAAADSMSAGVVKVFTRGKPSRAWSEFAASGTVTYAATFCVLGSDAAALHRSLEDAWNLWFDAQRTFATEISSMWNATSGSLLALYQSQNATYFTGNATLGYSSTINSNLDFATTRFQVSRTSAADAIAVFPANASTVWDELPPDCALSLSSSSPVPNSGKTTFGYSVFGGEACNRSVVPVQLSTTGVVGTYWNPAFTSNAPQSIPSPVDVDGNVFPSEGGSFTVTWWQRIETLNALPSDGVMEPVTVRIIAVEDDVTSYTKPSVSEQRWDYADRMGLVTRPTDDLRLQDGSYFSGKAGRRTYHPRPVSSFRASVTLQSRRWQTVQGSVSTDDASSTKRNETLLAAVADTDSSRYMAFDVSVTPSEIAIRGSAVGRRFASMRGAPSTSSGNDATLMSWTIRSRTSGNVETSPLIISDDDTRGVSPPSSTEDTGWHLMAVACDVENGRQVCQLVIDGETSLIQSGWRQCAAQGFLAMPLTPNNIVASRRRFLSSGNSGNVSVLSSALRGFESAASNWKPYGVTRVSGSQPSSQGRASLAVSVASIRIFPSALRRSDLKELMDQPSLSDAAQQRAARAMGVIGLICCVVTVGFTFWELLRGLWVERKRNREAERERKRREFEVMTQICAEEDRRASMSHSEAFAVLRGHIQRRLGHVARSPPTLSAATTGEATELHAVVCSENAEEGSNEQLGVQASLAQQSAAAGFSQMRSAVGSGGGGANVAMVPSATVSSSTGALTSAAHALASSVASVGQSLSIYLANWSWPQELTSVAQDMVAWLTINWNFSFEPFHDYIVPGLAVALTGAVLVMLMGVVSADQKAFLAVVERLFPSSRRIERNRHRSVHRRQKQVDSSGERRSDVAVTHDAAPVASPNMPPRRDADVDTLMQRDPASFDPPLPQPTMETMEELNRLAEAQRDTMHRQSALLAAIASRNENSADANEQEELRLQREEMERLISVQNKLSAETAAALTRTKRSQIEKWIAVAPQTQPREGDDSNQWSPRSDSPHEVGDDGVESKADAAAIASSQRPSGSVPMMHYIFKDNASGDGYLLMPMGDNNINDRLGSSTSSDSDEADEHKEQAEVTMVTIRGFGRLNVLRQSVDVMERFEDALSRVVTRCASTANSGVNMLESESVEIVGVNGRPATLSLSAIAATHHDGFWGRRSGKDAMAIEAYVTPHDTVSTGIMRGALKVTTREGFAGRMCPRHKRPLVMGMGPHMECIRRLPAAVADGSTSCVYNSRMGFVYKKKRGLSACPGAPLSDGCYLCPMCASGSSRKSCSYIVCEHCYEGSPWERLGSLVRGAIDALRRMGAAQVVGFLAIVAVQLLQAPVLQTCMKVVVCHATFQCQFPGCYAAPSLTFIMFVSLASLAIALLFIVLPWWFGLLMLQRKRWVLAAASDPASNEAVQCGGVVRVIRDALIAGRSTDSDAGVRLSMAWCRVLDADDTKLKSLYEACTLRLMWVQPFLMTFRALAVMPSVVGEPDSLQQVGGAWGVEMIFLVLTVAAPIYDNRWVVVIARAAAAHQCGQMSLSLLLLQSTASGSSSLWSLSRSTIGSFMLWLFVAYLVLVVTLFLSLVLVPAVAQKCRERAAAKSLARRGGNSGDGGAARIAAYLAPS